MLDPLWDEEGIFSNARLTNPASTEASRTVKFRDSAGKPLNSSCARFGSAGARKRPAECSDTEEYPNNSPSSSLDDNR